MTALRPFAGRMVNPRTRSVRTLADAARTGDRVDALRWLDALHSVVEAEEGARQALAVPDLADGPHTARQIDG
jgi:hypothetical protein